MNVRFEVILLESVSSREEYQQFKKKIEDFIPSGELQSIEQGEKTLLKISVSREIMFDADDFVDALEGIERVQSIENFEEIV